MARFTRIWVRRKMAKAAAAFAAADRKVISIAVTEPYDQDKVTTVAILFVPTPQSDGANVHDPPYPNWYCMFTL